jgi:hypothetical protein
MVLAFAPLTHALYVVMDTVLHDDLAGGWGEFSHHLIGDLHIIIQMVRLDLD